MNWVDILIIAIILIFIIIGCVKGFVFSILSIFGGTVNFIISLFLCKPMANFLNSSFNLESALVSNFTEKLSNISADFNTSLSTFKTQAELNSHINNTINNSSLGGFTKKILSNTINVTPENVAKSNLTLNNIISNSFSTFISIIISFIIVFILIYLILWLISFLSKKANQISDIKFTDRILGVIFGFFKGLLLVLFIFAILSLFNQDGLLSGLFNEINNSTIGGWIYNNVCEFMHKYINLKDIAKDIIDSF